MSEAFERSRALLGEAKMRALASAHVLVVGVGGVGSWCAEALVRTGLGHITLMDDDVVCESNINRQCPATASTVGRLKVEALRSRLLEINPACDVVAVAARFVRFDATARFDAIVDAIDSVECKAELIRGAVSAGVPIVSSMGAALRLDPTRIRVTRFDKVAGDGLARALRGRFRRLENPPKSFTCVWSDEPPRSCETRGSIMPVTAAFGLALASEVMKLV